MNHRVVSPTRDEVDLAVWPTTFDASVLPFPDEVTDDLSNDSHYLISYNGASVSKHPRGVSGAAVWWESDKMELIWRTNFRFAGTVTHCYKKGAILRVVKASVVRRFLVEIFGEA